MIQIPMTRQTEIPPSEGFLLRLLKSLIKNSLISSSIKDIMKSLSGETELKASFEVHRQRTGPTRQTQNPV